MFFVQGYKQHRAFIITQGPMKSTSRDFWKMVFSRKCSAIVMLSELCEQGEVQFTSAGHTHFVFQEVCYQYWPGQRTQSYGEFRIELISEESYNYYEDLVQQAKVSCVCTRYAFIELILNCPVQ